MRLFLALSVSLLVLSAEQGMAQFCQFGYPLEYMNPGGQEVVFQDSLPTEWYAIRMTPNFDCDVDSAYIAFGITKNSNPFLTDSIEVRVLNNTLPTIVVLDQFKASIPVNAFGQIPDSYWVIEFQFDNNTARIAPPRDFWLAWRLKGPVNDIGRIRMIKPAANPNRSVVINANGSTTPVYQYVNPTITDTVDLWAETRVCYYNGIPVELSAFTATPEEGRVRLDWQTATETGNMGFEVERASGPSEQGMLTLWNRIAFVQGAGTSTGPRSYRFSDNDPRPSADSRGVVRYRLRQVDFDGRSAHSPVVEAVLPSAASGIILHQSYPNPVSRHAGASVSFSVGGPARVVLDLVDALGRHVARLAEAEYAQGMHTVQLPLSAMIPGMYQYTLTVGSVRIARRLTVIE